MIPTPPAAFWLTIPWEAYICILFLVFFMLPSFYARLRGRKDDFFALSQGQAALNQQRAEFVVELQAAARRCEEELALARADRSKETAIMRADRDAGWDIARGQEALAHELWHEAASAKTRANALLVLLQRNIEGRVVADTAKELMLQYKPYGEMKPLRPLEEGPRKRAHEGGL